jgi:hypothetical protein
MKSAAYLDLCRSALSPADAAFLDYCTLDCGLGKIPPAADAKIAAKFPPFIRKWRDWEKALRYNLARYRAARLKREGPADVPVDPVDAAAAAKSAAAMESPLEADFFLDEARWRAVETFQGLDYFNVNTVYAYLLKLFLMERRSLFREEEGFTEYKGLYASIVEAGSGS